MVKPGVLSSTLKNVSVNSKPPEVLSINKIRCVDHNMSVAQRALQL